MQRVNFYIQTRAVSCSWAFSWALTASRLCCDLCHNWYWLDNYDCSFFNIKVTLGLWAFSPASWNCFNIYVPYVLQSKNTFLCLKKSLKLLRTNNCLTEAQNKPGKVAVSRQTVKLGTRDLIENEHFHSLHLLTLGQLQTRRTVEKTREASS